MNKCILTATTAALIIALSTPAFAQSKVTVEVGSTVGYEVKRVNRGPSSGWANWCVVQNKGEPVVDRSTCKNGLKNCSAVCIVDGKKIEEPWKATAK